MTAAHDIIDNRSRKLVDDIGTILESSESAKFATGYFFVSGLDSVAAGINGLQELRLLIGNVSNHATVEQIAEGYRCLEPVTDEVDAQANIKRSAARELVAEAAGVLREVVGQMDQSDDSAATITTLVQMIAERRLKVRVYTQGRLHAKAYIFNYGPIYNKEGQPVRREENGIAIVGSSNFTLSGVSHNTELNVLVHGNPSHAELTRWFDELWADSVDFDAALMEELQQSWAVAQLIPYDIYMKTLYTLVADRIEGEEASDLLWDDDINRDLTDFQKVAVRQAVQTIREYNGVFVADVVGLGKSYIGAAIIKHFREAERARPLINLRHAVDLALVCQKRGPKIVWCDERPQAQQLPLFS